MNSKNIIRMKTKIFKQNLISRKGNLVLGLLSLALLVSFTLFTGCSTDENQTVARFTELVMADEFDVDGAPNSDIWSYDIGTGVNGWGNEELQHYTDRPENVTVQNGMLLITVREEAFEGSKYTSARLLTKGKFEQKYGRFEARMRLPSGKGLWPAFWMLGNNIEEELDDDLDTYKWPFCGEIDIMENAGSQPTVVSGAVHGPGYSGGMPISKKYDLQNKRVDTGFHVYGIEWGPEYVNFYVDDVLYNQIIPNDLTDNPFPEYYEDILTEAEYNLYKEKWNQWVYDQPFYMLLNVAVGGLFDGSPNENTIFPQTMLVDYVRVYKSSIN